MNKRTFAVAACAAVVAVVVACNGKNPDTGAAPTADYPEAVAAPAPSGGGTLTTQSLKGNCEPTSTVLCANFESASPESATVEFFNPRSEPREVNLAAWRFKDRNSQADQVLVNVTHGTVPAGGRLTLTVAGAGCDTQYDASGSPFVPPTADLYGSPNYGLLVYKIAEGGTCPVPERPTPPKECNSDIRGDCPEECDSELDENCPPPPPPHCEEVCFCHAAAASPSLASVNGQGVNEVNLCLPPPGFINGHGGQIINGVPSFPVPNQHAGGTHAKDYIGACDGRTLEID